MVEVLFLLLGLISVASAVRMLLSDNAVHSALYLIVVMVCIAVLFLMLDAPFLGMVQIAVYAGAIMVLFLFVIMLLGAEKVDEAAGPKRLGWLVPTALSLLLAFGIMVGLALFAGQINEQRAAGAAPLVRVINVHAPSGDRAYDVFNGETPLAEGLIFGADTDFVELQPGDYTLAVNPAGVGTTLAEVPLTLNYDDVQTVILYGSDARPLFTTVNDDLGTTDARSGRLTVFNAYGQVPAVSLVDLQQDLDFGQEELIYLKENVAFGAASESIALIEDTPQNLALVDAATPTDVIVRFRFLDIAIERDQAQLFVLSARRLPDGGFEPFSLILEDETARAFGSPEAIGETLFIQYLLPFEAVAVLLLAAMIGAIVLTQVQPEVERERRRKPGRRKVSRPLVSVIAAQTGSEVGGEPLPALSEKTGESEPSGD